MSVTVRLSSSLQRLTGNRRELTAGGETVTAVLDALEVSCPGLKNRLFDDEGALRRFVMVFVDGVDVRSLQGVETRTPPACEIDIISAIAGG